MIGLLPLFLFFTLTFSELSVEWYVGEDLSLEVIGNLISKECYYGTYGGLAKLTLATCAVDSAKPILVNQHAKLCVVETREHFRAIEVVKSSDDAQLLWMNGKSLVVASASKEYPSLCLSTSEYNGAAWNVMTVPSLPVKISDYNALENFDSTAPNDAISDFIALFQAANLLNWDNSLAFGAPSGAWDTRNSFSTGAAAAVNYVASNFQSFGASTTQNTFRSDMCNNIIAQYTGTVNPNNIIVFGAHLDSRAALVNSTTQVAPGADNNGSGVSVLLEFANIQRSRNLRFQNTVRLMTFCGEEQGLVGSRAIAQSYRSAGVNVIAMYNVDMIGYTNTSVGPVVSFMTGSTTASLTTSCKNVARSYVPGIVIGDTSACCSDQQAFYENSYPSVSLFETNSTGAIYPDYHRSTDTPDKVNWDQVTLFAKAASACVLSTAVVV